VIVAKDFKRPTLIELRNWWRDHRGEGDVERLILEVQHLRLLILRLRGEADAAVRLAKEIDRSLDVSAHLFLMGHFFVDPFRQYFVLRRNLFSADFL
jgi:hypothetical protein